jgi:hypothetical protein
MSVKVEHLTPKAVQTKLDLTFTISQQHCQQTEDLSAWLKHTNFFGVLLEVI